MATIEDYPFLKAAIEDMRLAAALGANPLASPRHVALLLHDALEFLIYELLLAQDYDIYKNGQNTIGLDAGIAACKEVGVDLPLIGTVRTIQKYRGDAKHHAQVPQHDAMSRVTEQFRVIASRLVYEYFGQGLGAEAVSQLGLLPYHAALYESFRKYRTHKWPLAARLALGALLHKERSLLKRPDDYSGGTLTAKQLLARLANELDPAGFPLVSKTVTDRLGSLPAALEACYVRGDDRGAAEIAGTAYSEIDAIIPAMFDIDRARKLTPRLVQPVSFKFAGAMSWSKWQTGDGPKTHEAIDAIESILRTHPEIPAGFGKSCYAEDGDRYWKWWELAVFADDRWHSFHLDTSFRVSLESGKLGDDDGVRRLKVAKAVLREFEAAAGKD